MDVLGGCFRRSAFISFTRSNLHIGFILAPKLIFLMTASDNSVGICEGIPKEGWLENRNTLERKE